MGNNWFKKLFIDEAKHALDRHSATSPDHGPDCLTDEEKTEIMNEGIESLPKAEEARF